MTEIPSVGRKDFLPGAFFFQSNRFSRAEFGGEENLLVAIGLGVDHFGNHFCIELEYLGGDLNTLSVTLALRSVYSNFHFVSRIELGIFRDPLLDQAGSASI
jgi:hypothetical protein